MTTLTETSVFESGIYQLETDDPVLGGAPAFYSGNPIAGHANAQAQQLANRTKFLKDKQDDLSNSTLADKGAGMVGFNSELDYPSNTVGAKLNALPAEVDAAGTAASTVSAHNADETAHPALSAFITAAADRAESAADIATANGKIYASTTLGIAATVDGEYFSVPSAESSEYLILYKNVSEVANEVKRYANPVVGTLQYGDSIRFHPENGEDHTSSNNGLVYLPNSNNIFKTTVNYDTPVMNTSGTVVCAFSVPHHFYAGQTRKAIIVGVVNSNTTAGDIRIEYLARGASAVAAGDKHKIRVTLWPYGTAGDKRLQALSPVLPESFQRGVVFARVVGGSLQVDIVDADSPATIMYGTPVAVPSGWAGVSRLAKNICIGGTDADIFPQSAASVFGRQNLALWKGEVGSFSIVDTSLTDTDVLNIAAGADVITTAVQSNVRLHCSVVKDGRLSKDIVSNKSAVVDSLVFTGYIVPGSTIRRQSLAQYLTIDAIKDGQFVSVLNGKTSSEIKLTGQFAGVSGYIELRIIDSTKAVVRDWFKLCKVPSSGTTWEAWVTLPIHINALHFEARGTSHPTIVARSNNDVLCGYSVLFQAQSQVVFGTMTNGTYVGGDDSLNVKPRDWGNTVIFGAHGSNFAFPRYYRAELCPAFVGSGFLTIANYLRARTPYPLLLVSIAKSGTALSDLVNDDTTTRQWSGDKTVFEVLANKNRDNQYKYTAQVMNWGSTDTYNDYWEQILTPYLLGRGTTQIPKANIDHWLYDNVDFDPSMKFVVVPFSRDTGAAGTYDTDASVSAVRRKNMRDGAASLGYLIGPEATVYSIEGTTDSGTHPNQTDATYGIPLYSRSLAEAAAIGCGFGTWRGPTTVNSSYVKFTDGSLTAFLVGFTGPLSGTLYTLGGVSGITSFEVSTDNGVTWSKSGFTATIEDGMAVRITKSSGSYSSGITKVRCYPGSPGRYGIGYFPTWIAGALFKDGFPVSGGNDAYTVADV